MIRRLQLVPGKGLDGYSSAATGRGWKAGEAREVPPEVAAYLLSTFPDAFVEAKAEPKVAAPEERENPKPVPEPEPKKPVHRK